MKGRLRILSDLHLGYPACVIAEVDQLRPLLQDVDSVIFNGDSWQELVPMYRRKSAAMLKELREIGEELGVEMIFLPGNHDPGWPGQGWLSLAGGKILVFHGDAVMRSGSPWSREAFARHQQIEDLWARSPEAMGEAEARLRLAREIAATLRPQKIMSGRKLWTRIGDAISPPQRALEIIQAWAIQATEAARFAEHYFSDVEAVIIGHFHRQGVWQRCGKLVINTGAYVYPSRARWVEWDGGLLRTGMVARATKEGAFRLGAADGTWRFDSE